MKKIKYLFLIFSLCFFGGCATSDDALTEVTLVLDYVPNTNHSGIYVAQSLGYFEAEGLKVNIIEPTDVSSATLVGINKADFGISYQEDVTYALASDDPLDIKSIAAIIQHNTSGFVSLKQKNINSIKDFEGKVYAGWNAPSEEAVIKAIMKQNDADFDKLTITTSDGSGYASLEGQVDLIWDFEAWGMIQAKRDNYELNYFPLRELDERLDYYTPLIITNNTLIQENREVVQKFMNAISKGYNYSINHVDETVDIMMNVLSDYDRDFLYESQSFISQEYSKDSETWGLMKDEVWNNYTDFMLEYGLIDKEVKASDLYTNEFIK